MLHPEPAQKAWNPDAIRSDFPLIAGLSGYGRITYLDNAASAQKPRSVMASMTDGALTTYANVHRGAHRLRGLATASYDAPRARRQAILTAPGAAQVLFPHM